MLFYQITVFENVCWKEFGLLVFVWVAFLALQIAKVIHVFIMVSFSDRINFLKFPTASNMLLLWNLLCSFIDSELHDKLFNRILGAKLAPGTKFKSLLDFSSIVPLSWLSRLKSCYNNYLLQHLPSKAGDLCIHTNLFHSDADSSFCWCYIV